MGLLAAAAISLSGCSDEPNASGKPVIVATIYPLAAVVQQLVGDEAEVVCVLPPGKSPHAYHHTPRSMTDLSRADLIVTNGLGIDHWVGDAIKATGRKDARWFVLADELGIEGYAACDDHDHPDHAGHDHHHHGPVDPHLWLDPVLMEQGCEKLYEALCDVLPEHTALIDERYKEMIDSFGRIKDGCKKVAEAHSGKRIVTFHDAFGRLAERCGLEVAATLKPMTGPDAVTPEARARVAERIRALGLKVIFAEPQFSQDEAKRIEAETGARVLVLDPLGSPLEADRSTYEALMRYNLDTLSRGLSAE